MDGPNCIEAQICRGDFYDMLAVALRQCGGNPRMIHPRSATPERKKK